MNVVHLCDCMEFMKTVPDKYYELAIVDPPYRDKNDPTRDMRSRGSMESLEGRPTQEYFEELNRVSINQIVFGANNFELPQYMGFIVWDKGIPQDFTMSMAEIASLSSGLSTVSKIVRIRASGQPDRIHPTQKPVALYKWLLKNYAKPNDKIFDSHVGSGSIRIACHDMGFDFEGCEIDKDYWEAQEERYNQHAMQLDLFSVEDMQKGIYQGRLF